jgi:CheY-like chemotaxis protein
MDAILRLSQRCIRTAAMLETDVFDMVALDDHSSGGGVTPAPPVILVVDDDFDVGRLVRRLLHKALPSYEIIAVSSAADALRRIIGRALPLVIADFNMPELNGLQLITQLKRHSPQMRSLLITAYRTPLLETLAQQRGVDHILAKPFQLIELERLVSTMLPV